MKFSIGFAVAVSAALATPAFAQAGDKAFDGPYVGVSVGGAFQGSDSGSTILFDANADGKFGDTVLTTTGANAFSPGFCGGAAKTSAPSGGCRSDKDGVDYAARVGFDKQFGKMVIGGVSEFGKISKLSDSVSAFSLTPASFTLTRKIKFDGRIDVRGGYVIVNKTLIYGVGGFSFARVRNEFTSIGANFSGTTDNGFRTAKGYNVGGGVQHKITSHVSVGLEYLFTALRDPKYRLSVLGLDPTPPAGGGGAPPPGGVGSRAAAQTLVFRRGDDHFRYQSVRATVTFGF